MTFFDLAEAFDLDFSDFPSTPAERRTFAARFAIGAIVAISIGLGVGTLTPRSGLADPQGFDLTGSLNP